MKFPSKHFNRKEFECACGCGCNTVDAELLSCLEMIREHFDSPMVIHSGFRCLAYNSSIGSKPTSQHVKGKASDFHLSGVDMAEVRRFVLSSFPGKYGIGTYPTFIHLDTRSSFSRW